MKSRPAIILGVFVAALVLVSLSLPAYAAAPSQGIPTNTPEANGNIYYLVQAGDNCFRIASLYGIDDAILREQNPGINADCSNLIVGQKLLVGIGGPAAAASFTPGPSPTPEPPTVTPTPFAGTTEICVLLFEDINGDALREADEPVIVGGAISVTETNGGFSKTLETAINPDPNAYPGVCFIDVPEGNYNVGAAIPDNYNPTMSNTYTLDVKAGDRAFVSFGAQSRDSTVAQPGNTDGGGGPSPILGFFGGLLLLGGLGLGWYALRMRSPQSKLKRSGLLKR